MKHQNNFDTDSYYKRKKSKLAPHKQLKSNNRCKYYVEIDDDNDLNNYDRKKSKKGWQE